MAEGNPGAISAMTELLEHGDKIDPDAIMGGVLDILLLDTWGIYGRHIYILWNDHCGRNTRKLIMLIRGVQLGLFNHQRLMALSDDMSDARISIEDWQELEKNILETLPGFQKQ